MAVATTTNKAIYSGNGVQTNFPFAFSLIEGDDLIVTLILADGTEATLVRGVDYTMTPLTLDFSNGGNVVTTDPPAIGQLLVLYREMPLTQEMDYEEGDSFPAEEHEKALDKLTMIGQQLAEKIDRQIAAPIVDVDPQMELPNAAVRANMYPHFDANGDLEVVAGDPTATVSAAMAPVVGAATLDDAAALMNLPAKRSWTAWRAIREYSASPTKLAYIKKGMAVGLLQKDYLWPCADAQQEQQSGGFSFTVSWTTTPHWHHVKTVIDTATPANTKRLYLAAGPNANDVNAAIMKVAADGTRSELCYASAGISNGSTTFCLAQVSSAVFAYFYISTTGTLRCIGIKFDEGASTLTFSGDSEISGATTWDIIRPVDRWAAAERVGTLCCGVIGVQNTGTNGIFMCTATWGGSAFTYNTGWDFTTKTCRNLGTFSWGGAKMYGESHIEYSMGFFTWRETTPSNISWLVFVEGTQTAFGTEWYSQVHTLEDPLMLDCVALSDLHGCVLVLKCVKAQEIGATDPYETYMSIWSYDSYETNMYPVSGWIATGLGRIPARTNYRPTDMFRVNRDVVLLRTAFDASYSFYHTGAQGIVVFRLHKGKLYITTANSLYYTTPDWYDGGGDGYGYWPNTGSSGAWYFPTYLGVAASDQVAEYQSVDVVMLGRVGGLSDLQAGRQLYVNPCVELGKALATWTPHTKMCPWTWYGQAGFPIGTAMSATEILVGV